MKKFFKRIRDFFVEGCASSNNETQPSATCECTPSEQDVKSTEMKDEDERAKLKREVEQEKPNRILKTYEGQERLTIATSALGELGTVVKGGKKQFLSETAVASMDDYVTIDGIQYVLPHSYDHRIRYRQPWEGRELLEVLCNEFPRNGRSWWISEIEAGRIATREGPASPTCVWSIGMSVWHTRHRHESPVRDIPIEILHVCEKHVVVSKPPSMPVHPCGRYHRNSLIFLLAAQHGFRKLHVVHRLDKETSGVVIYSRSREAAAEFHALNKNHQLTKTYVAEVHGDIEIDEVVCEESLKFVMSKQRSIVHPDGKEASTYFKKLLYCEETNTSMLLVQPRSGRQHQIRAHIAYLGHPIVGDSVYGTGENLLTLDDSHTLQHPMVPNGDLILREGRKLTCDDCPRLFPKPYKRITRPFHLHALKYESTEFSYEAKPPEWFPCSALSMKPF